MIAQNEIKSAGGIALIIAQSHKNIVQEGF